MKIIIRIFLYSIMILVILVSALNILYLFTNYFLSSRYYQKLRVNDSSSNVGQDEIGYCGQIEADLNFVSVSKYLDTLPPTYYTWENAEDGAKREKAYYVGICSVSLQVGRRVTEIEAKRLAQYYVVPSIELLYGLLSRWLLWLLSILSLRKIFVDLFVFIKRNKKKSSLLKDQSSDAIKNIPSE